ncbi:uncharacterized protein LOC127734448 [Mytilus californianus]|uniref:uncharacterized protein LOC127734448 n=1 Tax=Mytilus californianus TaxID=6549 RepID=UPI0022470389|nr:uncharacterized protein LOC127734448 [Mytilus californianus]XP_052100274.1 uncharacterized protein LOC127734448 [Mytilus californianus]
MDIDAKLSTINHAIQELKQTQRKIWEKVHTNSEDTFHNLVKKQFEKLDEIIRDLEDKYGKHYSTLKEVTNMVVTLLSRVGELTIDIKKLKRYTCNTKSQVEETTDQRCHLRKTATVTPNEQSGHLENSQNTNEDNDLLDDGISGKHTESTNGNFECGIFSHISSVEKQPDGRKNYLDNKDNFAQAVNRINNSDRKDRKKHFSSNEAEIGRTNKTDTKDSFAETVNRINYSDRKGRKDNVSSNEAQIDKTNTTDTKDSFSVEETQHKERIHDSESNDNNINVSLDTACADSNKKNNELVPIETNMHQNQQLAENLSKMKNSLDVGTATIKTEDKISPSHVNRVRKHDSGYKQKRSAMSSDNRVAYHRSNNLDTNKEDDFFVEETQHKENIHDTESNDNNINVSLGTAYADSNIHNDESVQIDTNMLPNQPLPDNMSRLKNSGYVRTVKTKTKDKDSPSSVNRVCKNDFGYKQKRSAMSSDNRVAYHNKETCFEFGHNVQSDKQLQEDSPPSPNIKNKSHPTRRKPDTNRLSQMSQLHDFADQEFGYNPGLFNQPRSTREWMSYAEQLRENAWVRLQSGMVERGRHGHDVTLVLDCSERMRGQKFDIMIETAKNYVTGIKQVKMTRMLGDNIGLAVFGGTSTLILQSTCDYDLVLKEIGQLRPEGEAPLAGGLLMGLAGALGGGTSQIYDNEVPGYMVVFTDGLSANIHTELDKDINPSYLTGDFQKHAEISSVINKIAGYAVKIFYVPVGDNERNEVMESAVSETNGKVIYHKEIHRLVRLTQVLLLAAQVASQLRHLDQNPTAGLVRSTIIERTSNPEDAHEDCVDFVMEFLTPLYTEKRRGFFTEMKFRSLQLGDRVRRGPNWLYNEQDSGLAGTVVGHTFDRNVWVEWDSGHVNKYFYDEQDNIYTIRKVQEPRFLFEEMIAVGCRVKRGNDWTSDNSDGGYGSMGTVLSVRQDGSVVVRWDCINIGVYKMGQNGLFELQICDDPFPSKSDQIPDLPVYNYQDSTERNTNYQQCIDYQSTGTVKSDDKDITVKEYFDNYVLPVHSKTVSAIWEYENEKENVWTKYEDEINTRIEKAYERKPTGKTIVQYNKGTYIVFFTKMIQLNTSSGQEVRVRRKKLSAI